MDTSHYRRQGFILLLVLLHYNVFGLASKFDVSYGTRRIKTNDDQKRFLSDYSHQGLSKFGESSPHDKEHSSCTNHKSDRGPITRIFCRDGYVISKINFADYGNPIGTCEHFKHGNCGAPATLRLVKKNCLGKSKCVLFVTDEMFGPSHCKGVPTLAVEATCTQT